MGACQASANQSPVRNIDPKTTKSLDTKDIADWDQNDVYTWLCSIQDGELFDLAQKFRKSVIRGRVLDAIDDHELNEMGLKIGDKLLFKRARQQLFNKRKNTSNVIPTTTIPITTSNDIASSIHSTKSQESLVGVPQLKLLLKSQQVIPNITQEGYNNNNTIIATMPSVSNTNNNNSGHDILQVVDEDLDLENDDDYYAAIPADALLDVDEYDNMVTPNQTVNLCNSSLQPVQQQQRQPQQQRRQHAVGPVPNGYMYHGQIKKPAIYQSVSVPLPVMHANTHAVNGHGINPNLNPTQMYSIVLFIHRNIHSNNNGYCSGRKLINLLKKYYNNKCNKYIEICQMLLNYKYILSINNLNNSQFICDEKNFYKLNLNHNNMHILPQISIGYSSKSSTNSACALLPVPVPLKIGSSRSYGRKPILKVINPNELEEGCRCWVYDNKSNEWLESIILEKDEQNLVKISAYNSFSQLTYRYIQLPDERIQLNLPYYN